MFRFPKEEAEVEKSSIVKKTVIRSVRIASIANKIMTEHYSGLVSEAVNENI